MSIIQFITLILGTGILYLICEGHVAASYAAGSSAILFSFISWGIGMSFIFQKKFVALAIAIIVFKYAILGVIIYWLVHQGWLQILWFALGVASFVIAALVYAIIEASKEREENVI